MHHSSYEQINPDFLIGKLRYEIASLKDSDRIRIFLDEYFCTREPLQVALEVTPEEIHEQYDSVLPSVLSKPVSILGFEKNELVCICLNSIQELSSENRHDPICDSFNVLKDDYSQDIENGPYRSVKANAIKVFLSELERGLPTSLPDCRRLFNIEIVVVHPMHKGRGICAELIDLSIKLAKSYDCDYIATCATAANSQYIFAKNNFSPIKEIQLSKFLQNGIPVFSNVKEDASSCVLMVKHIKE